MSILDLSGVEIKDFTPIKPGKYIAKAIDAKIEDNFAKTGKKLTVRFKIIAGESNNREVSTIFNIFHSNEAAQTIGRQQLKGFMNAVGVGDTLENVEMLLGKVVRVNLKNEEKDGKTYSRINYFEEVTTKEDSDVLPF